MSSKANYVFDTNIIVSALLFEDSKPALALQEALDQGNLLLSMEVAEEIAEVLRRSKFDRYVKRKTREEFLRAFILEAVFVEIIKTIKVCRDPKDNKFLETCSQWQCFSPHYWRRGSACFESFSGYFNYDSQSVP